jgi:hypothetical protein
MLTVAEPAETQFSTARPPELLGRRARQCASAPAQVVR